MADDAEAGVDGDEGWVDSYAAWRPGLRIRPPAERRPRAPRLTRAELRVGGLYSRRQIHEALGGALQEYLPHVDGRVVCACLKPENNPGAPRVVLPVDGPNIRRWGEEFATQREYVPVFLMRDEGRWEYVGDYRVERVVRSTAELEQFRRGIGGRRVPFALLLESRPEPPAAG